jgi:hypothetical protein
MAKENRRNVRRTLQHKIAILNSDGSILTSCTMTDVSALGAKITTQVKTEIPDEFVLLLAKGGKVRRQMQSRMAKGERIWCQIRCSIRKSVTSDLI